MDPLLLQLIAVLTPVVVQTIGYAALGRKLAAVQEDLDAIKEHHGIKIVRGKVYHLRPVTVSDPAPEAK